MNSRFQWPLPSFLNGLLLTALAGSAVALTQAAVPESPRGGSALDHPTSKLPLTPIRPLKFTTDEGTWMSVDVSPDGKTLVFDLLGDLYTLPIHGGKATRIVSGQSFDKQPRYSPDGKSIVFVSDRDGSDNLWIVDADGGDPRQITKTQWFAYLSPEWTPDGRYIVVARNHRDRYSGPFDLFLHHIDGGVGQKLSAANVKDMMASFSSPSLTAPAFGADPRYIWATEASGRGGSSQLAVFDRENSKTYKRTSAPGSALSPVLSPDGKWLVYASRREFETGLRLQELATGEERWLATQVQRDDLDGGGAQDFMPNMTFTPDSRALIATAGGKIVRFEVPSGARSEIPFSAEVDQLMGPLVKFDYPLDDKQLKVRQIRHPRLSPDGKRVAFMALDRIWIADIDLINGGFRPGSARRLTAFDTIETSPVWSPDGKQLAFATWRDAGGDIYRVNADGKSKPQKLTTHSALYHKLAYSPRGDRIVFVRESRAQRVHRPSEMNIPPDIGVDIMWMPATGGTPKVISPVTAFFRYYGATYYNIPHFGPDPDRLVIYDPTQGLLSMRFDGTDQRVILEATKYNWAAWNPGGEEDKADDIILSPEGTQALVVGGSNVFLVDIPLLGPATTISAARSEGGPLPLRQISRSGGDFAAWSADGKRFSYSLGRSLFVYDVEQGRRAEREQASRTRQQALNPEAAAAAKPEDKNKPAYEAARFDLDLTVPKDRPQGAAVLRGARAITMKGQEVIEDSDIVVVDNRIAAIGRRGEVALPTGAKVIDVAGKTVLPGYVDIHAHMWPTWGVHSEQVWEYLVNLAYGVTATRDPQTMHFDTLDYSARVETGDLLGPRIFTTGRGIFASEKVGSLEDAREVVARYAKFLDTETIKQYLVGDRKRRQWIIMAAQELGVMPTTEGGSQAQLNFTFMMDGYPGLEHSIPITPLYKDVVQLAVQSGITYTPTLIVSYGGASAENYFLTRYDLHSEAKLRRFWPHATLDAKVNKEGGWQRDGFFGFVKVAEQAKKIAEAGGRIGLGGHGNIQGLGVHFELWGMGMGGMQPHDILRAGTLTPAEAIGHGQDFGSLEAGKLADLQVLDRNPLENIRNTNTVSLVMKNGRLYDANTLDERWPRSRKLVLGAALAENDDAPGPNE